MLFSLCIQDSGFGEVEGDQNTCMTRPSSGGLSTVGLVIKTRCPRVKFVFPLQKLTAWPPCQSVCMPRSQVSGEEEFNVCWLPRLPSGDSAQPLPVHSRARQNAAIQGLRSPSLPGKPIILQTSSQPVPLWAVLLCICPKCPCLLNCASVIMVIPEDEKLLAFLLSLEIHVFIHKLKLSGSHLNYEQHFHVSNVFKPFKMAFLIQFSEAENGKCLQLHSKPEFSSTVKARVMEVERHPLVLQTHLRGIISERESQFRQRL